MVLVASCQAPERLPKTAVARLLALMNSAKYSVDKRTGLRIILGGAPDHKIF
jgi:hypothetical protein